ncbi:MAG: HD domain-containing phosphohydrolase [Pseudomonadota bacterium]
MSIISKHRHAVALIDENNNHRTEVSAALLSFYDIDLYNDYSVAVSKITANIPDIILIGSSRNPAQSLGFIRILQQDEFLAKIPIVFIANENNEKILADAKSYGASDTIVKPYRKSLLINTISALLNANVEKEWNELPPLQQKALRGTVDVFNSIADIIAAGEPLDFASVKDACIPLVESIENNEFKSILNGVKNHDNYTYAHSMRVATMLSLFGNAAGLRNQDRLILASGGLLHDVGKMLIPHNILNKPGKLNDEEYAIMKTHVPETVKYLQANGNIPKSVIVIAAQHHEKIDGTGYPEGLLGSELNDLARMAAIVDVFSALTDRRVYKPPMEAEVALKLMKEEMATHLDQNFLRLFRDMLYDIVI